MVERFVKRKLAPRHPILLRSNVSSLRCAGIGGYFYEVRVFPVEQERKSIIACHESEITRLYSLLPHLPQDAI